MVIKLKEKCGQNQEITIIRSSDESHIYWKNHFHSNPLYFRVYVDFEAHNQNDNSSIRNKTYNFYKQNPVLNGYHIMSELADILETRSYESPLGYKKVDWFVNEIIKLENKIALFFKNTEKDNIMKKR